MLRLLEVQKSGKILCFSFIFGFPVVVVVVGISSRSGIDNVFGADTGTVLVQDLVVVSVLLLVLILVLILF